MRTVKETLVEAKSMIEAGWNKYGLTDRKGSFCLKGAIGIASGSYEVIETGEVAMIRFLATSDTVQLRRYWQALRLDLSSSELVCEHLPEGFDSIPVFNDDPQTTKEDILSVLDKAISHDFS